MKRFAFALIILIASFATSAWATDHYLSPSGSDSGTCTSGSPCLTLQYAYTKMLGGDTLWLANGTYDGSGNYETQSNNAPPSGSSGNPTIIRATNIPCQGSEPCNETLRVTIGPSAGIYMQGYVTSSYVKFYGLHFKSNVCIMGTDHWVFKQCSVEGNSTGNVGGFISLSATYTLFEDCIAFGMSRYGFMFYDENHLAGDAGYDVARRCITRLDYMNVVMPTASFVNYGLTYAAFLNCIAIDGDSPSYWIGTDEIAGAFSSMNVGITNSHILYSGCIAVNNASSLATVPTGATTAASTVYSNIAGVKVGGGFALESLATVGNVTAINLNAGNFSGYNVPTDGVSQGFTSLGKGGTSTILNNNVIRGAATNVTSETWGGDYLDYFASTSSAWTPTHTYTTDPLVNASGSGGYILYPVRVESGSYLAGLNGGMGATILNAIGADGSFYGDSNYLTPQGSLWPWPLEAWIKAQMSAMDSTITDRSGGSGAATPCPGNVCTMPSPTRGFCSYSGLDGVHNTITSYIWEYLGNQIPSTIYGGGSPASPNVQASGSFSFH